MLQEQIMKKAWKELTFNVQGKRLIAWTTIVRSWLDHAGDEAFVGSWLYTTISQTHMITPNTLGGNVMMRDVALVAGLHHLCVTLTYQD
jgi:hypothetical protein